MKIDEIEEWKAPEGSYSFVAIETYSGEIFSLRTGPFVSVLDLNCNDFSLRLKGGVRVRGELDCWKIIMKLGYIKEVARKIMEVSEEAGVRKTKKHLRNFLSC